MGNISPFTEHGLEILPLIFSVFCELLPFHIQQNNFIKLFGSIRFNPLPFEIISRITIHLSHVPSLKGLPQCGKVLLSPGQDTGGADSGALIWREAVLIVLKALIALLELIRQFIE